MTATNVAPPDTLDFYRLKRELRQVNLPLDKALFAALREAFGLCRGRQPQTVRELAEYYIEMPEGRRSTIRGYAGK